MVRGPQSAALPRTTQLTSGPRLLDKNTDWYLDQVQILESPENLTLPQLDIMVEVQCRESYIEDRNKNIYAKSDWKECFRVGPLNISRPKIVRRALFFKNNSNSNWLGLSDENIMPGGERINCNSSLRF